MSTPVGHLIDLENMEDEAYPHISTAQQTGYSSINIPADQIANQAAQKEMESGSYPCLSEERMNDLKTVNATHEQKARADQAAKREIEERLKRQSVLNEDGQSGGPHKRLNGQSVVNGDGQSGGPHIKLAVIGTTGSGKSATANTLLQKKKFHESTSAQSQASEAGPFTSEHSPPLTVTDTSGSWILPKIATGKGHIMLYVLVINLASPRFGSEDLKRVQSLKDYSNIIKSKRCIVLLTHANDALQGRSLYEYVQEIKGDPLYDLIIKDMEGWRVMAINNNCDTKYEADKQHEMIIEVLQRTYENANFSVNSSNHFLFCCLAVLSFVVIFLVIFLSAWYTADVQPSVMSTTMEPNMTTETTASVTPTDTTGTSQTQV